MSRKGFTLIELLVVISIIALLSSVVLGSLNVAREKGRIGSANYFASQVEHIAGDQAVGMWDFDECTGSTTADRSGYMNVGTITGATWSSDTPSGRGCSLLFNGSTDYVDVPNNSAINTDITQITMSAWVKTSDTGYHHILSRGLDWSGGNVILATDSDLGYTQFCFYTYGYSVKNCSGVAPDGKWHHVVGTYDGTQTSNNTKIYVDGLFKGTGTANLGTLPNRADSFRVANRAGNLMSGRIDGVRVFSKLLTGSEVGRLYAEGLGGPIFAREE